MNNKSDIFKGLELNRRSFIHLIAASLPAAAIDHAYADDDPDIDIDLYADLKRARITPGSRTDVWVYEARLRKGPESTLSTLSDSYLGPVIRVKRDQRVRIRYINNIPEPGTVHWHGLSVPEEMDGHPRDEVSSGSGSYTYEFTVIDRASTCWYHPHTFGLMGLQVYRGLAGLFIVDDEESSADTLPQGEYDIPLIIQDRILDLDSSLVYLDPNSTDYERLVGFTGDTITVNGQAGYNLPVKKATYRFRILNASNSRIYKLYMDNGTPFTVIGTDGGLLQYPLHRPYLVLGPGERYEILADFSQKQVNARITLRSMDFAGGIPGMGFFDGQFGSMRDFIGSGTDDMPIMTFAITGEYGPVKETPEILSETYPADTEDEDIENYRQFSFETVRGIPAINSMQFEMEQVESWEIVRAGTTEIWEMTNTSPLPVPVHVHGNRFRIIGREGISRDFAGGYVDDGYKDTILLMSGERARILISFTGYEGPYLYHSQNLEQADMGMMRNYLVEP